MKSLWLIAILSLLIISNTYLLYAHFSGSNQLVYVDSTKLLNNYKGMTDARKVYQQKAVLWKANIDTLIVEIQNDLKKYEKESSGMSAKERDLSRQLIQNKQQQLGDYQKATNEKAAQEDTQLTKQVLDEINQYIKEYGKNHKLRIILAATDYGNIAYAEEGIDITDEILAGLNKKYAGQ
jgi:outer membrane protein